MDCCCGVWLKVRTSAYTDKNRMSRQFLRGQTNSRVSYASYSWNIVCCTYPWFAMLFLEQIQFIALVVLDLANWVFCYSKYSIIPLLVGTMPCILAASRKRIVTDFSVSTQTMGSIFKVEANTCSIKKERRVKKKVKKRSNYKDRITFEEKMQKGPFSRTGKNCMNMLYNVVVLPRPQENTVTLFAMKLFPYVHYSA